MVKLQEFISESLVQIVEGVKNAQERVAASGAKINPKELAIQTDGTTIWSEVGYEGASEVGRIIEFDVAVVAAEGENLKGGIGIFAAIGAGYQAEKGKDSSTVSRIKFSVPVFLPQQDVEFKRPGSRLENQPTQPSRWKPP